MPQKRAPWLAFTKYRRSRRRKYPRTLSQALALLAKKLPQDNLLEAKNKACQTDFTEPDECNNEEETTKNPTTISDSLSHWSDIYVKEELDVKEEPDDFDEVPSSTTVLNTICNSPIYIKITKSCKKQKATQTNEQDVTEKNEVIRIETTYAKTYNTRTIESGKRIPKPNKLLMESWDSFEKPQKVRKKPKAKQTKTQKRLTQIMIESKNPSETTTQKKSERCGCVLCNGCSFTTFLHNATNRLLKLRELIKSAPSQKQVAAETNAGVNSGQQSMVTDPHLTITEILSADLDNAEDIQANLHEKCGQKIIETNENANCGQIVSSYHKNTNTKCGRVQ